MQLDCVIFDTIAFLLASRELCSLVMNSVCHPHVFHMPCWCAPQHVLLTPLYLYIFVLSFNIDCSCKTLVPDEDILSKRRIFMTNVMNLSALLITIIIQYFN